MKKWLRFIEPVIVVGIVVIVIQFAIAWQFRDSLSLLIWEWFCWAVAG